MSRILNKSTLEELSLLGDDPRAFVSELIDAFLVEAPTLVAAVREGVARGDAGQVAGAAHACKSMCANLGMLAMSEVARTLEVLARAGDLDAGPTLAASLDSAYDAVLGELDTLGLATH